MGEKVYFQGTMYVCVWQWSVPLSSQKYGKKKSFKTMEPQDKFRCVCACVCHCVCVWVCVWLVQLTKFTGGVSGILGVGKSGALYWYGGGGYSFTRVFWLLTKVEMSAWALMESRTCWRSERWDREAFIWDKKNQFHIQLSRKMNGFAKHPIAPLQGMHSKKLGELERTWL